MLRHIAGLQYIGRQTYRSEYYPPQYNDYDYTYEQEDAQSWGPLDYLYEGKRSVYLFLFSYNSKMLV